MKKLVFISLCVVLIVGLFTGCVNEDYSKCTINSDVMITEYYTAGGDLYQIVQFNRNTGLTIITTYYWRPTDHAVSILERIEVIRINAEGEIVD